MINNAVDYLIIGQGLCGSILADKLIQRGRSVAIIDNGRLTSSSIIAAGIMNPITGRRFVKSWMYDEISVSAINYYRSRYDNLNVLRSLPIYRILKNSGEENDWLGRSEQIGWASYMDHLEEQTVQGLKVMCTSIGLIKAHTIQINLILDKIKNDIISNEIYLVENFEFEELRRVDKFWNYKSISASKIVFCEGSHISSNPYFDYLPMVPAKGELLVIKSEHLSDDKIIKTDLMIVPLHDDYFWVGATYQWDFNHDLPSENQYNTLLDRLNNLLDHPFKIIHHSAAIRPTVKDRRPLLGCHQAYKDLYLFNGVGTKGTSLAPYFADHLISYIEEGQGLIPEVNINRFNTNG